MGTQTEGGKAVIPNQNDDLYKRLKELMPEHFVDLVKAGLAYVEVRRDGLWYCYEFECYRIFVKTNILAERIAWETNGVARTASEMAKILGKTYNDAKFLLYYYYKANLLLRDNKRFTLNYKHPQSSTLLTLYYKDHFSKVEIKLDTYYNKQEFSKVEISRDPGGDKGRDPVTNRLEQKKSLPLDVKKVLTNSNRLSRGSLSDTERLIIIKLVEWYNSRGKWYICVERSEELPDILDLRKARGDILDSIRWLEKLGIIYHFYDKRNKYHCFRISKNVVEGE